MGLTITVTGNNASTTQVGVVQLNDNEYSTSTTLAATANSINTTWAYAQAAFIQANSSGGGGINNPYSLRFTAAGLTSNANLYAGNVTSNGVINSAAIIVNMMNVGGIYTLSQTDSGSVIAYNNTATLTVNTSTAAGYVGFRVLITQMNTGIVTVQQNTNTTLISPTTNTSTTTQNASISLYCPAANTFVFGGNLPTTNTGGGGGTGITNIANTAVTSNSALTPNLPANTFITIAYFRETKGNTINVGLGTTNTTTDILSTRTVPGNGVIIVPVTAFTNAWFSMTAAQTIYAVASTYTANTWANSSLNIQVTYQTGL